MKYITKNYTVKIPTANFQPADIFFNAATYVQSRAALSHVKINAPVIINVPIRSIPTHIIVNDAQWYVGVPEEMVHNTLPAIISTDLSTNTHITVLWHNIYNLPGYTNTKIRLLGRCVFDYFTITPIEKIQVIGNLNNSGPNTSYEIEIVTNNLLLYGTQIDLAVLNFNQTIPGYTSDIALYQFKDHQYLIVRDFAGQYVYRWENALGVVSITNTVINTINKSL